MKLTATDLLTTCGKHEERLEFVTRQIEANAHTFVEKVNALLMMFGEQRTLTSGYRDPESNRKADGAKYSWHLQGLAADIEDDDGRLGKFILADESRLRLCGLYAEHPSVTWKKREDGTIARWVHVQSEGPKSGRRIFYP